MQYGLRPTQKISVHILLFFITAGIGNIFYYMHVKQKQTQWDIMMMNNRNNNSSKNIYIN